MNRKCEILIESEDRKIAICVDSKNKTEILQFIKQSDRYSKKFKHIVEIILGGHRNSELYDKEEINDKCIGVTAMKFFKGQENSRIYCKEQKTDDGLYIIVTSEVVIRKKTNKVSKKEIPIIEKVGSYEYTIEK